MGGLGKRLDWNGVTSILIHSIGEVSMFLFRIFLWSVLSFSLVSQVPWIQAQEPIQPIEEMTPKNRNLIELGKMLYFDLKLSKSGFISLHRSNKGPSVITSDGIFLRRYPFLSFGASGAKLTLLLEPLTT